MKPFAKSLMQVFSVGVFALTPTLATAQNARSLNDLVGARAAGAEQDLTSRGFVFITGQAGGDARYNYWWNSSSRNCVMVMTRDGRYSSIADAPATDCNQHGSSGSGGAVAAVAVGALIGAALLAHRSGHHDDQQHYADSDREADYERGFRDGLHNQRFNDRGASDAYGDGYRQGEQQRGHETNYGGNESYGGGHDQPANFNDLVGSRAPGAESQLGARGFSNVDSFRSGSGSGTIWWNPRTRQCLQMIVVEGRADSVVDIQSHARCR